MTYLQYQYNKLNYHELPLSGFGVKVPKPPLVIERVDGFSLYIHNVDKVWSFPSIYNTYIISQSFTEKKKKIEKT